jgi:hypothetical protein
MRAREGKTKKFKVICEERVEGFSLRPRVASELHATYSLVVVLFLDWNYVP